jgi:hypothetical protein
LHESVAVIVKVITQAADDDAAAAKHQDNDQDDQPGFAAFLRSFHRRGQIRGFIRGYGILGLVHFLLHNE